VERIIDAAFGGTAYTEEIDRALAERSCYQESEEANACFRGRRWQDVEHGLLVQSLPCPFVIAPEAFVYYLPAFMLGALRDPIELMFAVQTRFQPPRKPKRVEEFAHKWRGLNASQRQAVAAFLAYARDTYYSDNARTVRQINDWIDRFWSAPSA